MEKTFTELEKLKKLKEKLETNGIKEGLYIRLINKQIAKLEK